MRLQLVVGLALMSSTAVAQEMEPGDGEATSRVLVYSDDDRTSVVTSLAQADVALPTGAAVGAHVLIDMVSSASVDVMSAATERWDETRVEVGAWARTQFRSTDLSIGYTQSQENDWRSHAISVGASRELFQRNTVVSASYGLVMNTVGRAFDPNFEQSLDGHTAEVAASQLVDAKTRVGGAYTIQYWSGYMASPYRFVTAMDGSRGPERHPDSRFRQALSGYALRSLADAVSARIGYRLYIDDWGLNSHTATARLRFAIGDRYNGGLEGRVYLQNQANFYRETYETSLEHMTNDRELSSFWDAGASADLGVRVGPVDASAKLGAIHYRFRQFPRLPRRTALLASGGLKVRW